MRWLALLLLSVPALAGCADHAAPAGVEPANLRFPTMDLATVPQESYEARGILRVGWANGLMGVQTQREDGMPRWAVRDGATLYTTQAGMGWTTWVLQDYVAQRPRGYRFLAWDVPDLLAHATSAKDSGSHLDASASFAAAGHTAQATIAVEHTGILVSKATVTTAEDPESPYTLTPTTAGLDFPLQVPAKARPVGEVQALDAQARDGHVAILGWIQKYKDQVGRLPQDVSDQGLAVQHVGQAWPASPYDGQPMQNQEASGHFRWRFCSDQDAAFSGYGWDGAPLNQSFGRGCPG